VSITVASALKAHHANHEPRSLKGNIGDGFLYRFNPIFRGLRDNAIDLKAKYVQDDPFDYFQAPLLALGDILRSRRIPYVDNLRVLEKVEKRRPGLFKMNEVVGLKANYLIHESAHFIADRVLAKKRLTDTGLAPSRQQALKGLLAESLANSADVFGHLGVDSHVHAAFYDLNSYMPFNQWDKKLLKDGIRLLGPEAAVKIVFLSYLLANHLQKTLPITACKQMLSLAGSKLPPGPRTRKRVLDLCRMGLTLSTYFRLGTISFYFKYEFGIEESIFKLLSVDVMNLMDRSNSLQESMAELCAVLRFDPE
jgi:hypothetical protein